MTFYLFHHKSAQNTVTFKQIHHEQQIKNPHVLYEKNGEKSKKSHEGQGLNLDPLKGDALNLVFVFSFFV